MGMPRLCCSWSSSMLFMSSMFVNPGLDQWWWVSRILTVPLADLMTRLFVVAPPLQYLTPFSRPSDIPVAANATSLPLFTMSSISRTPRSSCRSSASFLWSWLLGHSLPCMYPPMHAKAQAEMTPSWLPPTPIIRSMLLSGLAASRDTATSPSEKSIRRVPSLRHSWTISACLGRSSSATVRLVTGFDRVSERALRFSSRLRSRETTPGSTSAPTTIFSMYSQGPVSRRAPLSAVQMTLRLPWCPSETRVVPSSALTATSTSWP
mmetsp:Transcript_8842/g.25235  ORF Transcript_8842/g.25235 Transcript_8842/m.25235 type:complete len:264 (-) Transcript_8842:659-1450(-)